MFVNDSPQPPSPNVGVVGPQIPSACLKTTSLHYSWCFCLAIYNPKY